MRWFSHHVAPAMLTAALASLGCNEAPTPIPPPATADPVARTGGMYWDLGDAASSAAIGLTRQLSSYQPTGVFVGNAMAPSLDVLPAEEHAGLLTLLSNLSTIRAEEGLAFDIGLLLPSLGEAALDADLCFDPADPASDPILEARRAALSTFLDEHPEIDQLLVDYSTPAPWDVSCTCGPCGSATDVADLAGRLGVLDALYALVTDELGMERWLWDRGPSAPDEPLDVDAIFVAALAGPWGDDSIPLRARSERGPTSPWAPESANLAETDSRRISADLDAVVSVYGNSSQLLLTPFDLHDRIRRDRADGVSSWFVKLDSPRRTALSGLQEANLRALDAFYKDFRIAPEDAVLSWVVDQFDLDPQLDETLALSFALAHSGRALALVTHPLGLAPAYLKGGVPSQLPIRWRDPTRWDANWAPRWDAMQNPDEQALVDVHQWGSEGVSMAAALVEAVAAAQELLLPVHYDNLNAHALRLHAITRAWRRAMDADIGLRAWRANNDGQLRRWLRGDGEALLELADEVDADVAAGSYNDILPTTSANLRTLANSILDEIGAGESENRTYPVISRVRWRRNDAGETHILWSLTPSGSGWVENAASWPVYDGSSPHGTGPASSWTANIGQLQADLRYPFRPCGEAANRRVCAADWVLWTPL